MAIDLGWLAGPLAFLLTDVDDLVVLVAFFADPAIRPRHVVAGQFAGITALIAVSGLAMLFRLVVPDHAIGFAGIVPLVLGIREAVELARERRATGEPARGTPDGAAPVRAPAARRRGAIGVALVTVANGGDNVAVYAPLFASSTPVQAAGLAAVFLAMTGLWLGLAWITVRNPLVGRHLARRGRWLLPPVLVLLGAWILWRSGTVAWLARLAGAA